MKLKQIDVKVQDWTKLCSYFDVQNSICFDRLWAPPTHSSDAVLSTCVVSRFLLFTDQSKLLVPAIGIAQLLAQLRFGNWYCLAIGIASAIGIAKAIGIASTCLSWQWDLLLTEQQLD